MTSSSSSPHDESLPPVDPALVEDIIRRMLPHWFNPAGRELLGVPDPTILAEARAWVTDSIGWALKLGGIRHGSLAADDIAGDTLALIREALASRSQWEAVATVTELERRGADGRALIEDPTGAMPAVDPLAARRARREWEKEQG